MRKKKRFSRSWLKPMNWTNNVKKISQYKYPYDCFSGLPIMPLTKTIQFQGHLVSDDMIDIYTEIS